MTPILWRITTVLALVCALIAAALIHGQRQYRAGHAAATTHISAELAKAQAAQAVKVLQKERQAAEQLAIAQAKIEGERQNAKDTIINMRAELVRLQRYAKSNSGSRDLSSSANATSTLDEQATATGWILLSDCAARYAAVAEVADEQRNDLTEWLAYGKIVAAQ